MEVKALLARVTRWIDPPFGGDGFIGLGFAFRIEAKLQVPSSIPLFVIWGERACDFQMIVQDIQGLIEE